MFPINLKWYIRFYYNFPQVKFITIINNVNINNIDYNLDVQNMNIKIIKIFEEF